MKNSIIAALTTNYGFEPTARANGVFAGRGSWFSGGQIVEISFAGDRATVDHREWLWDCDGECVYDRTTTTTCYAAQVWEFIPDWVLSKR